MALLKQGGVKLLDMTEPTRLRSVVETVVSPQRYTSSASPLVGRPAPLQI